MRVRRHVLAIQTVILVFGGVVVGCPKPDAHLEELTTLPCHIAADCDDGNPCTADTCNAATLHCVYSTLDGVAAPTTEQAVCSERVCQGGKEVVVLVAAGVSPQQKPADCRIIMCDGAGNPNEVNDDTDVLDDANDCTQDVCTGGIVENIASAVDTACGQMGDLKCNGVGQCVGCTDAAQCSNFGNFCIAAICGANQSCSTSPKMEGTELPFALDTPEDCMRQVCDDSGHLVAILDATDGHDDGNACTDDVCNQGLTEHPPTAAGEACGAGRVCDGLGNCLKNTSATCSNAAECASGFCVDGVCCEASCTATCQACSAAKKGYGVNGVCDDIEAATDPDNECATQTVASCGTTGFCSGMGACAQYPAGTICTAGSCMSMSASKADLCDGAGKCVDGGSTTCATTTYCAGGQCLPKKQNGIACAAAGECTSGSCADGVCCNTDCSGVCAVCNLSGSVGTCKLAPFPNPGACTANQVCDGSGNCDAANGASCGGAIKCASGTCSGGICKSAIGQPCVTTAECVSGTCVAGLCK